MFYLIMEAQLASESLCNKKYKYVKKVYDKCVLELKFEMYLTVVLSVLAALTVSAASTNC